MFILDVVRLYSLSGGVNYTSVKEAAVTTGMFILFCACVWYACVSFNMIFVGGWELLYTKISKSLLNSACHECNDLGDISQ